ncbi:MAG: OmpA family protein [Bacteroidales bacterium]|nr:OmpA family protein [Bacteroidales bacterium]
MKYKYLIPSILIFFGLAINSFAQVDLSSYSSGKLKKMGEKAVNCGDYYSAARYYEAYCKEKEDYKAMFQLAECYRYTRNYAAAELWYDKAYKANPQKNVKALYYYATMLKTSERYAEAKGHFKSFKKEYAGAKDFSVYSALVKQQLIACDSAPSYIANPLNMAVNPLDNSTNTEGMEYMPIFLDNNAFVYATEALDSLGANSGLDSLVPPKFFEATYAGNRWMTKDDWTMNVQETPNLNAMHGAFSPDMQRFYFVRCEKGKKKFLSSKYKPDLCKIYMTKNTFGTWQAPEELPEIINAKKTSNIQVAIGNESKKNDEILYFISDREGGRGGYDIWYSIFMSKKNEWRAPKNCGNKVNSAGDEISPYYDAVTRTLYFASNGFAGMGEFDIFRSNGEMSKWTPAENMGFPINSPYDDYYFALSPNGKKAFFATNRVGTMTGGQETCCDDLYYVDYEDVKFDIPVTGRVYELVDNKLSSIVDKSFSTTSTTDSVQVDLTSAEGNVNDSTQVAAAPEKEIKYLAGSRVALYIGNSNEKVFIASTETDSTGRYYFTVEPNHQYILQFENVRSGSAFIPFSTRGITEPDTLHLKDYGINSLTKEALVVKNIYYEYGKFRLKKEQKDILDESVVSLMREAPEIVVELSSHTDDHGGEAFNMKLSQKRADEIVNYVIKQGIEKERIIGKGYGYSVPVAPNKFDDGTDNPDGRAMNRRTEFKVIGTVSEYDNFIDED